MKTVNEIMQSATLMGACAKSKGVSDWKSLAWLFFTPQGREFCEKHNFPSLEMFREVKDNVAKYGVFVDAGVVKRQNDADIGVVGDTLAELVYDDNTVVHKVVLMHGAKAKIKASHYAVILLVNMGDCEVEIEKDQTVVVL
ncbi:hypothetical protein [uncultured Bacteroides sp.]|uniref:hypothetical protein n=1 Tax=uncultured Bacteroides sp. TaxID=162156 RepID=UPI0026010BEA|nr:hypothetical protein [uncultured Bacteroides sp.]